VSVLRGRVCGEREPQADTACEDILFIGNTPSEPPPAQAQQYIVKVALQVLLRPQLVCFLKATYSYVLRSMP
jgi:hypothetical protein